MDFITDESTIIPNLDKKLEQDENAKADCLQEQKLEDQSDVLSWSSAATQSSVSNTDDIHKPTLKQIMFPKNAAKRKRHPLRRMRAMCCK